MKIQIQYGVVKIENGEVCGYKDFSVPRLPGRASTNGVRFGMCVHVRGGSLTLSVCVPHPQAHTHTHSALTLSPTHIRAHTHTSVLIEYLSARMPEFFGANRSGHKLNSLHELLGATLFLTTPSAVTLGWLARISMGTDCRGCPGSLLPT